MNNIQEIWKPIKNFEGIYEVSNLGDIKSLERYVNHYSGGRSFKKERILKPCKEVLGYLTVKLCKNGDSKVFKVHRLVAQAFLGLNIDDKKMCACHIDDNPSNNYVDNLFLGSHKDNMMDKVRKGRHNTSTLKIYDEGKRAMLVNKIRRSIGLGA